MTDTITITWCVEDVLAVAPDLTEEQAKSVLQRAKHFHDASVGISWDVLEAHADIVREEGEGVA